MGAVAEPDRSGSPRNLLHRQAMFEITEAKPAPLFLNGDSVQAKRAHLRPQITRECVLGVDFGSTRRNLVLGKTPRRFLDGLGHLAESEIEPTIHALSPAGDLAEPRPGWRA